MLEKVVQNNILVMKLIKIILLLIIGGSCLGAAAYMCVYNINDWGWFLFAGLAILAAATLKDNITITQAQEAEDKEGDEC